MEIFDWLSQAGLMRRKYHRPLVSLCFAQSLDGCLTLRRGQPTPLSGEEAWVFTHQMRAAHDAILVGVNTVISDDPSLTVRLAPGAHPQPVVLDSALRTPADARLIRQHPCAAWIATTPAADATRWAALEAAGGRPMVFPADAAGRVQLPALLGTLADLGVNSLMVEGGARVITSFLEAGLVDLVALTIAPVLLGGLHATHPKQPFTAATSLSQPKDPLLRLQNPHYEHLGEDLVVYGKLLHIS